MTKNNFSLMEIKNLYLESIDSTQLWAKENYHSFDSDNITCITAGSQTQGYGRYNRRWLSPKDRCLTSTFYFRLDAKNKELGSLCQLLCLSLAKVLISQGLSPKIKWPNDLMLNEKKLAGVLCQTIFDKQIVHIFLGIGININMDYKMIQEIDQRATSLLIETKKPWDKKKFLQALQDQFLQDFSLFLEKGFAPFLNMLTTLLLYKDKEIEVFDGKDYFRGKIDSITEKGELRLKLKNGEIHIFQSGNIIK